MKSESPSGNCPDPFAVLQALDRIGNALEFLRPVRNPGELSRKLEVLTEQMLECVQQVGLEPELTLVARFKPLPSEGEGSRMFWQVKLPEVAPTYGFSQADALINLVAVLRRRIQVATAR